jgi:hypothetical protein
MEAVLLAEGQAEVCLRALAGHASPRVAKDEVVVDRVVCCRG